MTKKFRSGHGEIEVLKNISFQLDEGDQISLTGPSGSGKTTLLSLCAGLDTATSGRILFQGRNLFDLSQDELARLRNTGVGFIFQNFQLIPTLTCLENVMVPVEIGGAKRSLARRVAMECLERVNLVHRLGHYPDQLSGGEQQRVAIARSLSNSPKILFADEPTGNLDGDTSLLVEDLLFEINRERGTTLVLVTHDLEFAARSKRILKLKSGRVEGQGKSG